MKVTVSYNQKAGQKGQLFIAVGHEDNAVPLERGYNMRLISKDLTKSDSDRPAGIFISSNKFFRDNNSSVDVDLADLKWYEIDQSNICSVADYIKIATKRVENAFVEKYPEIESSITFEI
jgi:hypothetical protein